MPMLGLQAGESKSNSLATDIPVLPQSSDNKFAVKGDVAKDSELKNEGSRAAEQGSRKVFNVGLDPVYFFGVALVCVLILMVGLITLYLKNDRIMQQHISQLSVDSAALEARIAASASLLASSAKDTVDVSAVPEPVDIPADIEQQVVEKAFVDNPGSAINQPELNLDQLKALLAKQVEQIEFLAAENHELRLAAEFDTKSYLTVKSLSTVKETPTQEQSQHTSEVSVVSEVQEPLKVSAPDNGNLVGLISKGFNAYSRQDYASAQHWYDRALHVDPHNRDANLGVAAVAGRQGNDRLAMNRYRHLLSLNIDDPEAFSGLLSFSTPVNSIDVELRELIDQRSRNPSELYAVMGSHYSQKSLWPKAGAVYLLAVNSAAKKNSDHYYNLAVSLDNQGLHADAVAYYQQALAINDVPGFDRAMVLARLETLKTVP